MRHAKDVEISNIKCKNRVIEDPTVLITSRMKTILRVAVPWRIRKSVEQCAGDAYSDRTSVAAIFRTQVEDTESFSHNVRARSKLLLGLSVNQRCPLREQSGTTKIQRRSSHG